MKFTSKTRCLFLCKYNSSRESLELDFWNLFNVQTVKDSCLGIKIIRKNKIFISVSQFTQNIA